MFDASDGRGADRLGGERRAPPRVRPAAKPQAAAEPRSWEQPLRALIDAPAARAAGNPLAIELSLHASGLAGGGPPRLLAKLMRAGARGGWVNGSLNWSGLDSWHVQNGEYRSEHVALVRELYAVHRAREGRAVYYSYGADKALDLGGCDSAQLWSLLEEADRLGLKLVHARPGLGEVRRHERGELLIDVTQQGDWGSIVRPILQVDGEDADGLEPLLFIGSSGHGVVCAERDDDESGHEPESRRLRLVQLVKPAPAPLQRMILGGERLQIPAGGLPRFAEELCPELRSVATVVSSDGSFTPPEISAPTLVLRASYGADHAVEVGWGWAYRVGAATRHAALASNGSGPGFRDLDAERTILAGADFTGAGLERFGLLDGAGRPTGAHTIPVSLTGIDSMRLTTEMLPLLIHLSETKKENDDEQAKRHRSPTQTLEALGVLSGRTVAAHCVWMSDADLRIIKARGVGVAHCPSSNMMLGSGVAPVPKMLAAGIAVGLGPDGPAGSNNDFDMFEEMDLAAKLQKVSALNPQVLPASAALEMATIRGARALGMDKEIGSLEVGKRADMIMVRVDRPNAVPMYDPISQMVYALKGEDVRDVMVNGKPVVRDARILTLDEAQILQKAAEYRVKVAASLK